MEQNNIIAVAQTRVSTEKQISNTSLGYQEQEIIRHCNHNKISLIKIFKEEGDSGYSYADRKDLQQALDFCTDYVYSGKHIDYFITYKIDRFTRNQDDFRWFVTRLYDLGIKLRSVIENFDDSIEGEFIRDFYALVADKDRKDLLRKLGNGHANTYRAGFWPNNPPLGYKKPDTFSSTVRPCVPDEKTYHIIKYGWELLLTGDYTLAMIIQRINMMGFAHPKSGNPIKKANMSLIFRNKFYAGYCELHQRKSRYADFDVALRKGEWYQYRMIELDEWYIAQDILIKNSKQKTMKKAKVNPNFILSKVLRCNKCGNVLTGYYAKKIHGYYKCNLPHKAGHDHIKQADVENAFMNFLQSIKVDQPFKDSYKKFLDVVYNTDTFEQKDLADNYRKNIDNAQKKIQSIINLMENEVYSVEIGKEKIRHEESILAYNERLLAESLNSPGSKVEVIDNLVNQLERFPQIFNSLSPEQKVTFCYKLFPKGLTYTGNKISNPEKSPALKFIWTIRDDLNDLVRCTGHKSNLRKYKQILIDTINWADNFKF
jgi:DNA invertase Pin-like site-specific DNA recombinase